MKCDNDCGTRHGNLDSRNHFRTHCRIGAAVGNMCEMFNAGVLRSGQINKLGVLR